MDPKGSAFGGGVQGGNAPCRFQGRAHSASFRLGRGLEPRAVPAQVIRGRSSLVAMIDPFGRSITYLRVSVTDRCDLRCVYCMAEDMHFLPKAQVLTMEELERLCAAFIRLGTTKIRITGGEPLVRRGVMSLFQGLGSRIGNGLQELTVTTNGTQLAKYATQLVGCGGAADQRLRSRHAGPGGVYRNDPLGPDRAGAGGHLRRQGGRAGDQDQHRRDAGRERGRVRPGCWRGAASTVSTSA